MIINQNKLKRKHARSYIYLLLMILILAIGIPFYIHLIDKHVASIIPSTNSAPKKVSLSTKKSVSNDATNNPSHSNNSQTGISGKSNINTSSTSPSELTRPFGVFVSNHSPSLSGSSIYQNEQSVCNTTPGAHCYIEFTKGTIIKQLASQTTNAQGATYWTWNVNEAGLTQGTWQIIAVASLNGQTSSAQDSNNLKVQQ